MYDPQDALELHEGASSIPHSDTELDNATSVVQSLTRDLAREQGGTEHVQFDPSEKGNGDGFDLDRSERVHCDPQGFQYYDMPRDDGYDDGGAGY